MTHHPGVCGNGEKWCPIWINHGFSGVNIAANTWVNQGDDGSSTYLIFAMVVGEFLVRVHLELLAMLDSTAISMMRASLCGALYFATITRSD
ncbi:hypothetical protein E4U22_004439, partial [Claviceps purpurea]